MWTLALETTSNQGSVALLRDDAVAAETALEGRNYGSEVFRAVTAVLAGENLSLAQIGLFAVADGPGSFTGVRIGLTAVKGFIEVLGTPAVAVSTLRAVAAASDSASDQATLAVLDASRGEIYYGLYPEGEEGLETLEALRSRLAAAPRRALTPHPQVQAACPALELVTPQLAVAVGRLGLADFRAGRTQSALALDARYIRRSDAELYARAL